MKPRSQVRRRGQPLIALVLVMVSWVGARAALWANSLIEPARAQTAPPAPKLAVPQPGAQHSNWPALTSPVQPDRAAPAPLDRPVFGSPAVPLAPPNTAAPPLAPPNTAAPPLPATGQAAPDAAPAATDRPAAPLSPRVAAGHQQLWLAGMNLLPAEPALAMAQPMVLRPMLPALARPAQAGQAGQSHWSVDGWLLLRPGGNAFNAPGAGLPGTVVPAGFYGGSQGGLVLRYFLAPDSRFNPALYLRGSSGIEHPRGEELAAGFSLRPVPGLPLRLMAEGRVTRTTTGTIVRPAAALVSELPPLRLPLGTRAEAYVQTGYVGGRSATAFVDGQARFEQPLIRASGFELRAGGGAWGGAQRGASRLDIGPTATLAFRLGPVGTRISADYRWRVAGNAAPGSGLVLTLSAGF